jgi:hypothetical protein
MMISHKDRMIFFHNPKVCGTSMAQFFRAIHAIYCDDSHQPNVDIFPYLCRTKRHISLTEYHELLSDAYGQSIFNGYWKFAFVRNPWDRVVSLYHYNSQNHPANAEKFAAEFPTFKSWVVNIYGNYTTRNDDYNVRFQNIYTHIDGEQVVDFVGRYEKFNEDIKVVLSKLHHSTEHEPFPHYNKSDHGEWRSYYTDATRNMISEIFAEDIELFGYTFD